MVEAEPARMPYFSDPQTARACEARPDRARTAPAAYAAVGARLKQVQGIEYLPEHRSAGA